MLSVTARSARLRLTSFPGCRQGFSSGREIAAYGKRSYVFLSTSTWTNPRRTLIGLQQVATQSQSL